MKTRARWLLIALLLPLSACMATAQTEPTASARAYTAAELDQMLAPIALYPDSLLSQMLMAATYPLEVVQAARWSRAHPDLEGEEAVGAVADRDWDPSVKSLVAFPQILQMMDEKLEWTERLGDAFLAQQAQVTEAIQRLRRRAYDAGTLRSDERIRVERYDGTIVIVPAQPTVVYVPYYDPLVIYGPWPWPAYPPVYWAPWPGYYVRPGYVGFSWSLGISIGPHFFFSIWDWPQRYIRVVPAPPFYYRRPPPPDRIWRHEPEHRRGVPYRNPIVRERFRPPVGSPEERRVYRGFPTPSPAPGARPRLPERPRAVEPGARIPSPPPSVRPPLPQRPSEAPRARAPAPPPLRVPSPVIRPAPEARAPALEGLGRGPEVRRYSERGQASTRALGPITRPVPSQQGPGRVVPRPGAGAPPGGQRGVR